MNRKLGLMRGTQLKRRQLAHVVALGAVASSARAAEPARAHVAPVSPWALIAPLSKGEELGFGWTIAELSWNERGAAVLTLAQQPTGRKARVDICRRGGEPRGIAWTDSLDFLLMNGATGEMASDERLGRALRALAARVAPLPATDLSALLSHDHRLAEFGDEPTTPGHVCG